MAEVKTTFQVGRFEVEMTTPIAGPGSRLFDTEAIWDPTLPEHLTETELRQYAQGLAAHNAGVSSLIGRRMISVEICGAPNGIDAAFAV
jgi:hypothetical protein